MRRQAAHRDGGLTATTWGAATRPNTREIEMPQTEFPRTKVWLREQLVLNLDASRMDDWMIHIAINQSIKIYLLSNRNITVYTMYASTQKAAREAHAH